MTGFVKASPLFRGWPAADVERLESAFVAERFSSGDVILREGNRSSSLTASLYLIVEGIVRVQAKAPDGGWAVDRTVGPGHMVGLVALLTDGPRTATCTASGVVTAARLDRRALAQLGEQDPGVYARFQIAIGRQLARDLRQLSALLTANYSSTPDAGLQSRISTLDHLLSS